MASTDFYAKFIMEPLEEAAWKELSRRFPWNEKNLMYYQENLCWKEVSRNREIVWTSSILETFKEQLDWKELSRNESLELTHELIERYIDRWEWEGLLNRADNSLYSIDFIFRYEHYISTTTLLNSQLWNILVERIMKELALEITF